ncbi:MAG: PepSY-associated TM helix domain-containing protein [Planctomycetes bacterium]|nr:PepSY-associated TM helix domain-containing protein [Planctomycetota bacterium]
MSAPRQRTSWAAVARWLHTYLSLVGFGALLFFSVTGITLNHAGFFELEADHAEAHGSLPKELLPAAGATADATAIEARLRAEHGLSGALADFHADAEELSLVWKGPAYAADVVIQRADGEYELCVTRQRGTALIDDLHKGRDSGAAWSLVIDVSAVVMIVAALTGLWLLFYVQKRKNPGLLVALVGCVVLVIAWALFVP